MIIFYKSGLLETFYKYGIGIMFLSLGKVYF